MPYIRAVNPGKHSRTTAYQKKINRSSMEEKVKKRLFGKTSQIWKWRGMLGLHPRLNSTRKGITEPDKATLEEGGSAGLICLAIARLMKIL